MATIPMTSGFTLCPEGKHIFRIYDVNYEVEFGRVEVKMVTAKGYVHTERFYLMNDDGTMNDTACNRCSIFSKIALNNDSFEEIDHTWLIDRYIGAEVIHNVRPNKNDPTKTVTFVNLGKKWAVDGFDTEPCKKAMTLGKSETPASENKVDLDSLLG